MPLELTSEFTWKSTANLYLNLPENLLQIYLKLLMSNYIMHRYGPDGRSFAIYINCFLQNKACINI
jgi:hypothetical protein